MALSLGTNAESKFAFEEDHSHSEWRKVEGYLN